MIQASMVQKIKVIPGVGAIHKLPGILVEKERLKPLFVCDRGIVENGILDLVVNVLKEAGIAYAIFSNVLEDPPEWLASEGFEAYTKNQCDCVIGLGGGSAIDTAKAINILCYNEGPILNYAKGEQMNPAPGLIVIPTTSGTGSEMSDGLVITSGREKMPILADKAMSEFAILDPELTKSMPPMLTAATGFDALAHVVEAYTTTAANGLTDMLCEKAIETIKQWLPIAVKDGANMAAREKMSFVSCMGGFMLTQAHSNAGHSIAHVLGGYFKIPHGHSCAYALPYTAEFNATALPDKTAWIARCFGAKVEDNASAEEIGDAVKEALISFREKSLGIKKSYEWQYEPEKFDEMAEAIIREPFQAFNPVEMKKGDAVRILKAIFEK